MKKNSLVILISTILIILSLATITYAAFVIKNSKGPLDFTVGNLSYELQGDLVDKQYIYPGVNLVKTPFILVNNSTIDSEVRIKVDFYINNQLIIKDDYSIYFTNLTISDLWVQDIDYYYLNINGNSIIDETTNNIAILDEIIFDGYKINNDYQDLSFKFKLTLEAKQAKNVSWENLGSAII